MCDLDLSIIIVNWNTRELLAGCLASVRDNVQTLERSNVKTFVVDNASSDGSAQMVRERFPWVQLIENDENVGFVRANNQVLEKLDSVYVMLLNSDAILISNAIQHLISCMERRAYAGVIGPTLVNSDGTFQASYADFPTILSCLVNIFGLSKLIYGLHYPSAGPEDSEEKAVNWVGGACMLVRSAAMQDVGILDENIVMYAEEMDWCRRMRDANWQVIFCPEARVVHYGGGSSARSRQWVLARQWQSTLYYIAKHHGSFHARSLRLCVLAIGLLRALVFSLASVVHSSSREKWLAKARANLSLAKLETNYDGLSSTKR